MYTCNTDSIVLFMVGCLQNISMLSKLSNSRKITFVAQEYLLECSNLFPQERTGIRSPRLGENLEAVHEFRSTGEDPI